jgi:hypothetical protein
MVVAEWWAAYDPIRPDKFLQTCQSAKSGFFQLEYLEAVLQ